MSRFLLAALISMLGVVPAQARELTFGGIEIGVTSCEDAERILSEAQSIEGRDISAITLGQMFHLGSGAMGVDFIRSGTVICNAIFKGEPTSSEWALDKNFATVAAIELIIDKQQARTVADLLSQSYREQARKLPNLGSGSARYASDSGKTSASISYVHMSFDAQVKMSTRDFDEMLNNKIRKEEQERQHKLEGAF